MLTAILAAAGGAAADPGLTLAAETATLGPDRTTVLLRGTYSCGPFATGVPDRGVIDLSIEQGRSGGRHRGRLRLPRTPSVCDSTSQPFEVTLTGTGGKRFRQGAAAWSGSGYVEGDTGVQHVQVPPTLITHTR